MTSSLQTSRSPAFHATSSCVLRFVVIFAALLALRCNVNAQQVQLDSTKDSNDVADLSLVKNQANSLNSMDKPSNDVLPLETRGVKNDEQKDKERMKKRKKGVFRKMMMKKKRNKKRKGKKIRDLKERKGKFEQKKSKKRLNKKVKVNKDRGEKNVKFSGKKTRRNDKDAKVKMPRKNKKTNLASDRLKDILVKDLGKLLDADTNSYKNIKTIDIDFQDSLSQDSDNDDFSSSSSSSSSSVRSLRHESKDESNSLDDESKPVGSKMSGTRDTDRGSVSDEVNGSKENDDFSLFNTKRVLDNGEDENARGMNLVKAINRSRRSARLIRQKRSKSRKGKSKQKSPKKKSKKHSPKKHSIKKHSPKKHSIKKHSPKKHSIKKHSPKKHSPKKHSPKKHSIKKHSPKKHSPKKHSIKKHSPKKHSPKKHSPKKHSPKKHSPKKHSIKKHSIKKHSPKKNSPKKHSPKKHSIKKHSIKKHSPKKHSPKKHSPKKHSIKKHSPKKYSIKKHSPKKHSIKKHSLKKHSHKKHSIKSKKHSPKSKKHSPKSKKHSPKSKKHSPKSKKHSPKSKKHSPKSKKHSPKSKKHSPKSKKHSPKSKKHSHSHKHSHKSIKPKPQPRPVLPTPKPVRPTPRPVKPTRKPVRRPKPGDIAKLRAGLRWKRGKYNNMCECQASGDPHYKTFDGAMIHFMGTCEYTLVKSLPIFRRIDRGNNCGFEVTVANEHRHGQTHVSFTKMVRLRIYGVEVSLLKDNIVLINGVRRFPPIQVDERLTIVKNWKDVTVYTGCGVEVSFKDNHLAKVLIPKRYARHVTGLCGDCNRKPLDDYRLANGTYVTRLPNKDSLIGRSYAVETLSDSTEAVCETKPVPPFVCKDKFKTTSERLCHGFIDQAGPFKGCLPHLRDKARRFYENCQQDVCSAMDDGLNTKLFACRALEALGDQCLNLGILVKWRTAELCPLNCPANSHFTDAASACPPTCVNPNPKGACTNDVEPGCECDEGYLLDNNECVRADICGCLDNNKNYIPINATFESRDCKQKWRCVASLDGLSSQLMAIDNKACDRYAKCVLRKGVRRCMCRRGFQGDGYSCTNSRLERKRQRELLRKQIELRKQRKQKMCECTGSGDPHYRTFDGQMIHFQGTCTYTLAKLLNGNMNNTCGFEVRVTNEHRNNNERVAFTRDVYIRIKNVYISLLQGRKIMVNGEARFPPVIRPEEDIRIVQSGQMMEVVSSNCGIEIAFDGKHRVDVRVPKLMGSQLSGICGDCNGRPDDYRTKDGVDVSRERDKYSLIGNSYLVRSDMPSNLAKKCEITPPPVTCNPESLTLAASSAYCGRLTDPKGPFAKCAETNRDAAMKIFDSCVLDLCSFVDQSEVVKEVTCMAYEALAGMCESSGISVKWRTAEICPLSCPANSQYNPLMSGCQSTCLGPAPELCDLAEREGCECEEGYVLDGGRCIQMEDCGCRDADNIYLPVGGRVTSPDCRTVTTCKATNLGSILQTSLELPNGCAPGAECVKVLGENMCQCKEGFFGDGTVCEKEIITTPRPIVVTEDDFAPQPTVAVLFPTPKLPGPQVPNPTLPPKTPPPPGFKTPQPPTLPGPQKTPPPPIPTTQQKTPAPPTPPQKTPPPPIPTTQQKTPAPPTPPQKTPPPPIPTTQQKTPAPPTPPPQKTPPPPKPQTLPPPQTPPPPRPQTQAPTPPPPTPPMLPKMTTLTGPLPPQKTPPPPLKTPPPPSPPITMAENPVPQIKYEYVAKVTEKPIAPPCECLATGDPHYRTFDGARLEIYDPCKYIMAETLRSDFPCAFRVEVKNEKRPESDHPTRSYTRLVDVRLTTDTIRLHRGGKVFFNDKPFNPGYTDGKITIISDGTWTNVTTACGLNVSFDGDKRAVVRMAGGYRGLTKGICGNCDGNVEDDVMVDGRFLFTFDTMAAGYHKLAQQFLIADDSDKPDNSLKCEPPLHPYGYQDKR